MNLLKRISENFMQQVMSFIGIKSPSLEEKASKWNSGGYP